MMAFSNGKVGHLDNEELVNQFKTAIAVAKEGGDVEEISKKAVQSLQDQGKKKATARWHKKQEECFKLTGLKVGGSIAAAGALGGTLWYVIRNYDNDTGFMATLVLGSGLLACAGYALEKFFDYLYRADC